MLKIDGHVLIKLSTLLEGIEYDKDKAKNILSDFECPLNKDVETFLHERSILFEEQGIAKTQLVFASYKDNPVIVGYFALANKSIVIKHNKISTTLRKRLSKFGTNDTELKQITITAPLIGQLGKNHKYANLISGDLLLKYACDEVRAAQMIIGGKIVYLECANEPKLIDFYEHNGFVHFGNRMLDEDEKDISTKSLIQMLRYF